MGFTAGNGKLRGLIGAVLVQFGEKVFELSGFTDQERELTPEGTIWASMNMGETIPAQYDGKYIKRGQLLTFKYRDITSNGIPMEARYWRQ